MCLLKHCPQEAVQASRTAPPQYLFALRRLSPSVLNSVSMKVTGAETANPPLSYQTLVIVLWASGTSVHLQSLGGKSQARPQVGMKAASKR
jgi:hypothetical protein